MILMPEKTKILVMTPTLIGGSWVSLAEPIKKETKKFKFIVAGLGPVEYEYKEFLLFNIPYFDYVKVGQIVSSNALLNFLYELPLILMASLLTIIYRPKILVGNGLCVALSIIPLAKLMDKKIVVSYHGTVEFYLGKITKKIVQILSNFIDEVLVNSKGSKEDISSVVNPKKITLVKHWAHDIFFSIKDSDRYTLKEKMGLSDKFVILYVGRVDKEKLVPMLIEIIEKLSCRDDFDDFYFIFIGRGELVDEIKELEKKYTNVKYFSYIGDRKKLSNFYAIADLVWSYGDTTYLARPAIEALASGVPVLIPDIPAVSRKITRMVRIRHDLIPKDVGWIVDAYDIESASKLILRIKREKVDKTMRAKCRNYARKEHSMRNIEVITNVFNRLSEI